MSTPHGYNGQVLPVAGSSESRVVEENDVVYNGEIIGADPDANVRLQILKDAGAGTAGGGSGEGGDA